MRFLEEKYISHGLIVSTIMQYRCFEVHVGKVHEIYMDEFLVKPRSQHNLQGDNDDDK